MKASAQDSVCTGDLGRLARGGARGREGAAIRGAREQALGRGPPQIGLLEESGAKLTQGALGGLGGAGVPSDRLGQPGGRRAARFGARSELSGASGERAEVAGFVASELRDGAVALERGRAVTASAARGFLLAHRLRVRRERRGSRGQRREIPARARGPLFDVRDRACDLVAGVADVGVEPRDPEPEGEEDRGDDRGDVDSAPKGAARRTLGFGGDKDPEAHDHGELKHDDRRDQDAGVDAMCELAKAVVGGVGGQAADEVHERAALKLGEDPNRELHDPSPRPREQERALAANVFDPKALPIERRGAMEARPDDGKLDQALARRGGVEFDGVITPSRERGRAAHDVALERVDQTIHVRIIANTIMISIPGSMPSLHIDGLPLTWRKGWSARIFSKRVFFPAHISFFSTHNLSTGLHSGTSAGHSSSDMQRLEQS